MVLWPRAALQRALRSSTSGIRRLHELLPRSELVVIPDAGHSPVAEAPDALSAAVGTFLERSRRQCDGANFGKLRLAAPVDPENRSNLKVLMFSPDSMEQDG